MIPRGEHLERRAFSGPVVLADSLLDRHRPPESDEGGPEGDHEAVTAERPAQLAFGHGVHYCLGATLARAEIAEALPILAARLPDLELAGPPVLRPEISGIVGPDSLPIRFAAG